MSKTEDDTYTLLVQNENLALQKDSTKELLLTAPDSIGMIQVMAN